MEHSKHIWRAVGILLLLLVAFIAVRQFLIPASFGAEGFYRYDSIGEFMSQPVIHGGKESCKDCHKEEYGEVQKGKHAKVSCEVCHGPLAPHVKDGKKAADMSKDASSRLCAYCHRKLVARPAEFPQVDYRKHLEEEGLPVGAKISAGVCAKCHEAHAPSTE
ncbi:MAG: cytochrome c3 family protein [Planctomycetota bacterium]|jgi:hypothetical protein